MAAEDTKQELTVIGRLIDEGDVGGAHAKFRALQGKGLTRAEFNTHLSPTHRKALRLYGKQEVAGETPRRER